MRGGGGPAARDRPLHAARCGLKLTPAAMLGGCACQPAGAREQACCATAALGTVPAALCLPAACPTLPPAPDPPPRPTQDFETFFEPIFAMFAAQRRNAESLGDFTARVGFDAVRAFQAQYIAPAAAEKLPKVSAPPCWLAPALAQALGPPPSRSAGRPACTALVLHEGAQWRRCSEPAPTGPGASLRAPRRLACCAACATRGSPLPPAPAQHSSHGSMLIC